MKVKTSKGFTLAELLIVMAIIVVLAAVAIPTFSRQLETARETGDLELIRSAYTDAMALATIDAADGTLDGNKGTTALVTDTDPKFRYASNVWTVKLETATTQSVPTFNYVNAVVAKVPVGTAASQTLAAVYDDAAKFTFSLDDNGNLSLTNVVTDKFPT